MRRRTRYISSLQPHIICAGNISIILRARLAEAATASAAAASATAPTAAPTASAAAPATTATTGLLRAAGHSARGRVEHITQAIGYGFESPRHTAGNIVQPTLTGRVRQIAGVDA